MTLKVDYFVPTRVIVGKDCVKQNAQAIYEFGQSALIVTGGKSAKLCGALDDVTQMLDLYHQKWTVFDKVTANPDKEQVQAGAECARRENVDFIIAIGGGSPMDAGKAIAYYAGEGEPGENALPVIAIPTTAGTGSEVTQYAILTDHEKQTKTSIASVSIFPKIALLDARYSLTMKEETTINTAIDALSHAVEGKLTVKANPLTDFIASQAIRIICGILAEPKWFLSLDFDKREKLLYASMLAGMVIANTGTTALHSMGYSLTYFKDTDHGKANGVLMAEFLKFYAKSKPEPVSEIIGLTGQKDTDSLGGLLRDLLGKCPEISAAEIKKYAAIAIEAKNIKNTAADISRNDIENIYTASSK